tara:strand:- start:147 stop:416 length:270 start_codon:yes stop_codon:yes gene_type:complete
MSKKTNDLKITDKELENVQAKVKALQNLETQIGRVEVSKMMLYGQMTNFQDELRVIQSELEDKYGKVSINLTDGTITETPEENEVDKKD